ncbi:MAG: hypothetical protein M9945_07630 [Aquamicrobium sp.]|uniref:hypothetical protein n=1 Tax=Aquamicrobium sp. TaxID=1872579 RepID=UPI00349E6839|nr:hypothetical protein [Aquamicrobium sp.]
MTDAQTEARAIAQRLMLPDEDVFELAVDIIATALAAALSRTGAMKVKPLEWEDSVSPLIGPNVYFSRAATVFGSYRTEQRLPDSWMITAPNGDAIRDENNKLAHHETLEAAKDAAQADYERRILSALTTEPAAPEGWQEAGRIGDAVLDWMVKFDLLDAGNEYYVSDVLAVLNDLTPSTRPAEQAVTEAMRRIRDYADKPHADRYVIRNMAEDALKAAIEAGRHD